jgi:hypothetical protein
MSRAEVAPTNLRNSLRFKEFSRYLEMIFEEAVLLSIITRVRLMSRRQIPAWVMLNEGPNGSTYLECMKFMEIQGTYHLTFLTYKVLFSTLCPWLALPVQLPPHIHTM